MPRKAKSVSEKEPKKSASNVSSSNKKVASSSSKEAKKTTNKKVSTTKKEVTRTKKNATSKSAKKVATKSAGKRKTTSTTKKASKLTKKIEILEYYDLPYRYNETVVKILAQTPTTLFVYWDISDKDKENFISTFGEYFFNNTKPVLIIDNETMHYHYEVDINDFANSWYLHINDAKCDYRIELGRRPIVKNEVYENVNYIHVSTSNEIE